MATATATANANANANANEGESMAEFQGSDIEYVSYGGEHHLPLIMRLVDPRLSLHTDISSISCPNSLSWLSIEASVLELSFVKWESIAILSEVISQCLSSSSLLEAEALVCLLSLSILCVLSTHHDIKLARVVLFAADNIPPLKEPTYDYGYALDSVMGPDGKITPMACYCGAADCQKCLL
ncbi:acyl-CoA N-acyltransferases (NAT) superfamily protein [Actinidia rufa]|uniref:Acyl-CoA N-acyltransferases (NAT) superfamily protein n=1 Tax=Actinidia rufa TaxID=165716 RepID=A0A7J0DFR5_9ERIC|nr:acyl-CoA N-acyltransferases (NAT) superfamily protein [Actinidia rufa]